ncbi:MAG: putative DNA binding domain-containing protein [Bacteroidales bacterium]|nr:putative DNA binding domain-containing protein [Bacteroidales bacterium]MBN2836376.1 putative DNA binding domain-containing protein [Candidatus Delongbacteria bacterium]
METTELIEIISRGEDSRHQFKENLHNQDSLAQEIIAFSNSGGGKILIGINDKSLEVKGLSTEDIGRLNKMLSNAASQSIVPSVNPYSENITHPDGLVMVITVLNGISKPYMDNKGVIWVKSGSDKRKATSREEIQRMFQTAGLIHGDEIPANGISISDIDLPFFERFFQKEFGETIDEQDNPLQVILENMNLAKDGIFNVAGALLFSKNLHFRLPAFNIKAVSYPGNSIDEDKYIDSRDITGKVSDMFQEIISFISINIRHRQGAKSINSTGETEIPKVVLEELIANALIHRDYFITAPIRVFVFSDRVEIISPGHLPNNLTIQNILSGNSNIRNPILASFATKLLPYRGLGSGIRRALKAYPNIEFNDDRDGNIFIVTIKL